MVDAFSHCSSVVANLTGAVLLPPRQEGVVGAIPECQLLTIDDSGKPSHLRAVNFQAVHETRPARPEGATVSVDNDIESAELPPAKALAVAGARAWTDTERLDE